MIQTQAPLVGGYCCYHFGILASPKLKVNFFISRSKDSKLKDIPRTMYFFFIGLLLVAFQVACHGAPERLLPVPQLVRQEEKHVEKRACK